MRFAKRLKVGLGIIKKQSFLSSLVMTAFGVAAVGLVGSVAQAQTPENDVLKRIRETGMMTIAHREASVPFSYLDAQKQPVGYSLELCQKVAEAVRRELKLPTLKINYLMVTPANRMPAIMEGKADIECGSTTNTTARRKDVDFTVPHFFAGARMVVKTASGIKNWDDLRGKAVVTTKGTTNAKTLKDKDNERVLKLQLLEGKDHGESFAMVQSGKAVAFVLDDVLLFGLRAGAPSPTDFAVVGDLLTVEPYAMILPKNNPEYKKIVDREMTRIIVDNEIQALYRKWFQLPVPTKDASRFISMNMPMGYLLRDSFKFPTDKVPD
jgi:ABC-type amino acid transport substrate-binding protein